MTDQSPQDPPGAPPTATQHLSKTDHADSEHPRLGRKKRILRALLVIGALMLLTWLFGHAGVLHKLEMVAGDFEMRINPPPEDSPVVLVTINDEDFEKIFEGKRPLNPAQLQELIGKINNGNPAVIGIDIDTSSPNSIHDFQLPRGVTIFVWERELREMPKEATGREAIDPLPILGGQRDVDPSRNLSGIPLLLDDAEDHVTRRYRRSIPTKVGPIPSFPWAIARAYLRSRPEKLTALPESTDDLVIRFSGDREGSHRLHFTAGRVRELSDRWPETSPLQGKIVILGGSYLGEDRHDTPIGRITGMEVMANVVETELGGGGHKVPGRGVLFLLELFEAFVLIFLFHALQLRYALAVSIVLIPLMAAVCSELAFGNLREVPLFALIVAGLLLFEIYEHFRRTAVPSLYHDLAGKGH